MSIHLSDEQIQKLGDYLAGTCHTLEQACEAIGVETEDPCGELDENTLSRIDDTMFECMTCNWWAFNDELAEHDGENICMDCFKDNLNKSQDDESEES